MAARPDTATIRALLLCAGVTLAACVPVSDEARGAALLATPGANPGIRTLSVMGGTQKVRGPDGYCVDRRTSRPTSGFAVLAGCALVSDAAVMPSVSGIITVQFGRSGTAIVGEDPEALAALMRTDRGRALLSQTGDPATVTVRDVRASADRVTEVYFTDTAPGEIGGVQADQWRAFFDLDDRLVTLGVRGTDHDPLSQSEGTALLRAAVAEILRINS